MRTLVHLSDLHFGRIDQALIGPLTALVKRLAPDLVVVSGDLTQRAREHEFVAARDFLDTLPGPQIVVPGNHDVPLFNVARRFLSPLEKYRRFITPELAPEYVDDQIAVLGINTARSLTLKDGRVNRAQIGAIRHRFASLDPALTRIVVSHHPFDLPAQYEAKHLARRASLAMATFAESGVDLLLAGHLHASHAGNSAARYPVPAGAHAALVVQAGTATSTRGRGEANSFNLLRVAPARIELERYSWQDGAAEFGLAASAIFKRIDGAWSAHEQS